MTMALWDWGFEFEDVTQPLELLPGDVAPGSTV